MTIDNKIRDKKNSDMILTEKQQKYRLYPQLKLIDKNILQVKNSYLLIKAE